MIEYIKTDCPLNSIITIEFEDKTYKGKLISIDDKLLRIETEKGISALTAKKLENLTDYHAIVDDKQIQPIIEPEKKEENIKTQIKQEISVPAEKTIYEEPTILSEYFTSYNNATLNFPTNTFALSVPKVDKFESDEETFEISQQIQRVHSKYSHAKTLKIEKNRLEKLQEIESLLKTLLANHYFNDDLRYNIAFINYELKNIEKAISFLSQTPNIEKKKVLLLFISYLHYENKNLKQCLFYYSQYFNISEKTENEFYFLLKLIEDAKAFYLLNELIIDPKINQRIYFNTLFWLKTFDIKDEYQTQIKNFEINENSYIELATNNIKLLQSRYDTNIKQEFESFNKSIAHKTVSPNAEIIQYWKSSSSGQIRFKKSNGNIFLANFNSESIIEDKIRIALHENSVSSQKPIQVLCYIEEDKKSSRKSRFALKRAYAIQYPKRLDFVLNWINNLIIKEEYEDATGILHILKDQFPKEEKINDLLERIPEIQPVETIFQTNNFGKKPKGKNYSIANQARQAGKWEKAKQYFKFAIEANDNKESAIKDLAQIYNQEGDLKSAIDLLEKNVNSMENKKAAKNLLADYYGRNEQYSEASGILNELLGIKGISNKEQLNIKKRMAANYMKAKNYKKAKKILSGILKNEPDDIIAQKWLDGLLEAEKSGSYDEIDTLFNESDFAILMTGLSPLISNRLENCEYAGLKAPEIASENFSQDILNRIRNDIRDTLRNKPKERANYRLTEAKLMQSLEPDNEYNLKSVLAKYFNDIALSCAGSNYPAETIRYYYLEAFSLETNWKYIANQVSIYISTFYLTGEKLVLENQAGISIEKSINKIFSLGHQPLYFWESILEMSIANPTITAQILSKIYKNEKARKSAFSYLNSISIHIENEESQNEFKEKWNDARQKRKMEFDTWFNEINALNSTKDFNSFIDITSKSLKQLKPDWLQQTDTNRYESIKKDIIFKGMDYLKQTAFDEKERLYGIICATIDRLVEDIKERPTRFSYEGFLPLLEHTQDLIDIHFENVQKSSSPIVSLHILGEFAAIENIVELQATIRNEDKTKSPIYDIEIYVEDSEHCQYIGMPVLINEPLRGGDEITEKLSIKVSDIIVNQKIGDVKLVCKYKARNTDEPFELKSDQTVTLYDKNEFEIIDNVFARFANSNAVKDKSMFFGRNKFIQDIVKVFMTSTAKSIVIYGQKRSGKSSVLYHLKEELNKTEKAFCIDFSLGSILTEWSIPVFYDKILREIGKELRKQQRQGTAIPVFNKPDFDKLKERPTSIFDEVLEEFLENCLDTEGWQERRLTILIDEFTYLYSSIQRGTIPNDFMKTWKDITDKGYFNSVLIGQDVMPDFQAKFPNVFAVTEPIRLNYLNKEDARALIEKPILFVNKQGKEESRFIGNAIEKIIDYTAGNPYYIQIFCDRLVSYLNDKKSIRATIVSVNEVAQSLIKGKDALTEKEFDNLLTAGDADLEANPVEYTFKVLKNIAEASENLGSCTKQAIVERLDDDRIIEKLDEILKDLHRRQVITSNEGYFRIQVQLFHKWLINR